MRRVQSLVAKTSRSTALVAPQRGIIEPLSTWWTASWTMSVSLSFIFWFPVLTSEWILPSLTYAKVPHVHFINERRAEYKLRSQLDDIYTVWTTELDQGRIDDAISRTF